MSIHCDGSHLMLVLGEDSVVALEVVLLEDLFAITDLHVQKRVAEGNEIEVSASHLVVVYKSLRSAQGVSRGSASPSR